MQHVFDQWNDRSEQLWELDVERLRDYGIEPPDTSGDRSGTLDLLAEDRGKIDNIGHVDDNGGLTIRPISADTMDDLLDNRD